MLDYNRIVHTHQGRVRTLYALHYIALATLLVLLTVAFEPVALAADLDKVATFNIPTESLDKALLDFGAQAHIQIMFAWSSSTSRPSQRPIIGAYAARQVLALLLNGTGFTYIQRGNTIEVVADNADPSPEPSRARHDAADHEARLSPNGKNGGPISVAAPTRAKKVRSASLQEVTVTGTRIHGVQPVGIPLQEITGTDIQRSGYTSLDELLQAMPDNFRGGAAGASPDALFTRGANSGYNATDGSGVDLRGLGNDATLVLLNGHRVAPSGSGFYTDISSIPLAAIDHIDVLTDGSSAIYGSDAVAGVVNIVLKQHEKGIDTNVRYGGGDGFSTYTATADAGQGWDRGDYTLSMSYSGQGSLDADARSFTSSIPSPTSIFPMSHQVWMSATGHENVGFHTDLHGDFEYSDARRLATESFGVPAGQSIINVPRWSGSLGANYSTPGSWIVSADFVGGEGTEDSAANAFTAMDGLQFEDRVREVSRFTEPALDASGALVPLAGGDVRLSIGGSYLTQTFSHLDFNPESANRYGARRAVDSGYGELQIPVVGGTNAVSGVRKLTISGAGRYDHYSDFGSTTNYKVGISWYPVSSFQVRGAYSTSFRAPAVGQELVDSETGTAAMLLYALENPTDTGEVPVLALVGGQPHLRPESATNLTLGLEYRPAELKGISVTVNYYEIHYKNQLAAAPFSIAALNDPALAAVITEYPNSGPLQALVASGTAMGIPYIDLTQGQFGSNPLISTDYLYDLRTTNASRTDTSGFDVGAVIDKEVGLSELIVQAHATYINQFITQLIPTAPEIEEANTVGYPARLRITTQVAWELRAFSVAVTGNYVGGYLDNSGPTMGTVGSYTTLDLVARYDLAAVLPRLGGSTISLGSTNLLNRNPPYVEEGGLVLPGSHYDAANASPIGRMMYVEVTTHW